MATSDGVALGLLTGIVTGVALASPWMCAAAVAIGLMHAWRLRAFRWWLLAWLLGAGWGTTAAVTAEDRRLKTCADGAVAIVEGLVTGLPDSADGLSRFELDVSGPIDVPRCGSLAPRRLRLSWFGQEAVAIGELWQFEVRLRRHRNFSNPGGFDYVAWAAERGIDGSGSVRRGIRVAPARATLDGLRDRLSSAIDAAAGPPAPLFRALSNADARGLTDATWESFRATGTVHLLVISGLHVGMAAALGALVGAIAWRAFPILARRFSDHAAAAVVGMIGAGCYAAIAGFALPVTRAWIMSSAALLWWSAGRRIGVTRLLTWTLVVMLLCDPSAMFDTSLWLSFGAVVVLIGYFGGRRGLPWGGVFLRAQGVLFVGLLPVLIVGVGQFSWFAPVANAVSVPLVSVILVPLMLIAMLLLPVHTLAAQWCYAAAGWIAEPLLQWTEWLAAASPQSFWPRPHSIDFLVALLTAALILLPLKRIPRLLALVPLIVVLLAPDDFDVPWGEVRITVLDVGQGLALIVDTANERALVDAGPRHPSGFDLGAAVVVPALRATTQPMAAPALDLLIVSHADVDHAGGATSVMARVQTRAVLTGEPFPGGRHCRRGQSWQWSGVQFRMLAPSTTASGNAASCVVHVRARSGTALLPGDVGVLEEVALATRRPIAADLLVAPHHGSRSSSSPRFVAAVRPVVVVISAGSRNTFGHPHADVLSRYASLGVSIGSTAQDSGLVWESTRPAELRRALEFAQYVP